uniref:Uncharacterized protein n=1 Tax=Aegilops tauschii subsp. strangulata TaxID=200361 RepID=A0A453IQJ4_AEGTS
HIHVQKGVLVSGLCSMLSVALIAVNDALNRQLEDRGLNVYMCWRSNCQFLCRFRYEMSIFNAI